MVDFLKVLFDESHSSAWSITPSIAADINPVDPGDASYATPASALRRRGNEVVTLVRGGGGLVVLGECEQDRYGNNLNELLARFGLHRDDDRA